MTSKPFIIFSLLLFSFNFPAKKKHIKIYLIGDSTMCIFESTQSPLTGWGMPFAHFFDSTVSVDNRARGGRSTKTFLSEKRWQPVADSLREGDYVLMQFGHNDESREKRMKDRFTPVPDFKINLIKFITESRAKHAIPVLITPVTRFQFSSEGLAMESHLPYTTACYEIAKQYDVPLIDLDKKSRDLLQKLGPENAKMLFMILEPSENPHFPQGDNDITHYNDYGARLIAEIVLSSIRDLNLELAERVASTERID